MNEYVVSPQQLDGLRPSKGCLAILNWFKYDRLRELENAVRMGIAVRDHLEAARVANLARVRQQEDDLRAAIAWEISTYGNSAVIIRKGAEAA